jgi:uncharacterized protein
MSIEEVNPFVYSHPIAPEDVIDRDLETEQLLRNALGGHDVRLYAPRKYGKTSLLLRALRDAERDEGMIPVHVDLYRVSSIADVTVRFERAYSRQLKGAVRKRVEDFLQKTGIGLSLGAYGISASLQLNPKSDPLPALHALLDLPTRLEASGGYRAFIALDEFQDIDKIPGLDGLLRRHIQDHGEVASYVFAGSEPGLMKQLFENRERPLYGSAIPLRLERLAGEDIAGYVDGRFRRTGRTVGEALHPLVEAAKGHPQRAMLLAHRLWEEVPAGAEATLDHWLAAYEAALSELEAEFDAQWRGYDTTRQKTMRALVAGHGSPYKADVLRRLDLTPDGVKGVLPRLEATAEIEKDGSKRFVVDPLLVSWIARLDSGADRWLPLVHRPEEG